MSDAPGADPAVGLGQIQAADPTFDLELFTRQAVETFLAVKSAIQDGDLTPVFDRLADPLYDELRVRVEGLLDRDAPRFDGPFMPLQVTVAAADHGGQGDAITLRIRAATMQYVAAQRNPIGAGPSPLGSFTEFWTFNRPPGAVSGAPPRPECPTCGAPIGIDTGRICRYCKTLLPAPRAQTGWLVVAIHPAQENPG